jgi:hypothetical protein
MCYLPDSVGAQQQPGICEHISTIMLLLRPYGEHISTIMLLHPYFDCHPPP